MAQLARAVLVVVLLLSACAAPAPDTRKAEQVEPMQPSATLAAAASTVQPTATTSPAPTAAAFRPAFSESPCPFTLPPNEIEGETVLCGFVTAPELHSQPNGETIRLAVVVFKAQGDTPQPDPVILLAGGPGEKTVKNAVNVLAILGQLRDERDLIVFDQRGVGLSEPALECPEFVQSYLDTLDEVEPEAGLRAVYEGLMACRDRLVAAGYNLSAFNTTENAADVDDIRRALGYEQINLYGGSYGSLLAQAVLRDHPEDVRSALIGAALPAERSFFVGSPKTTVDAALRLLEACAEDAACNEAYPDLQQTLYDVIETLNAEPAPITITNPLDGKTYDALLTGDEVFGNLVVFLYLTNIIPVLPQAIFDVANGDYALMAQLSGTKLALLDASTRGMMFSVLCAEDLIGVTPQDYLENRAQMPPALAGAVDPEDIIEYGFFGICENWPVQQADLSVKEPVQSDVPVLILEGEFDPVTPLAYAQEVARRLSNSAVIEFPGVGHNVLAASACANQIARDFIDDPTAELDDACLAEMTGVAFDRPKEETGEITLKTLVSYAYELSYVAPEGWEQPGEGTFVRGQNALDNTALIYDILDMSPDDTVQLIAAQLRLADAPDPSGERTATEGRTWTLYSSEVQGVAVEFAVSEMADGNTLLIVLQAPADERAALVEAVFLPAIDALQPLASEPGAGSATPQAAAVDMELFTSETFGFEGVKPAGWAEIAPGVYNRGQGSTDAARLIQQAAPGATADELNTALAGQLQLTELPDSSGAVETDALAWDLYEVELDAPPVGKIAVYIALAETDEAAYVVLLQAKADEAEALREAVFMPALQALTPGA